MTMDTKKSNLKPALTLFFLTPVISEVLFGSTPASRAYSLIIECLLYGSAALLIREFARRKNLSWVSIIILGYVFGILLECLLLQSVFNPLFLGFDLSLGRTFGVNWLWGESIIGYHAVWSITLPILITELIYPAKRNEAWLKKSGLYFNAGLVLLGCAAHFAIFYKMSGYMASPVHFTIASLLVIALVVLAGRLKENKEQRKSKEGYWYFLTGVVVFFAASIWLSQIIFVAQKNAAFSAWAIFFIILFFTVLLIFVLLKFIKGGIELMQRFSIAFGALLSSMLFGLIVLAGSGSRIDVYFHLGFICIVIFLMLKLKKRLALNLLNK